MDEPTLTDAELVILSLICEQPLHGYQIEQEITQRNMRVWTDLASSSIYYVLKRLEEKKLIQQQEDSNQNQGAPRKIYQITPLGETIWKKSTLKALSQPKITYTNFLMGLHNLGHIPPQEALQAVQSYRSWLAQDLQRQHDELENIGLDFFPLNVLFEYGFVLGDAELSFLDDLIGRLEQLSRSTGPNKNEESP